MIQILIRDLYGGVVFNEAFPNLPIAAHSISLFIHLWQAPLSQVVFLRSKGEDEWDRRTFKIYQSENGGYILRSVAGSREETVILPDPVDESEEDIKPGKYHPQDDEDEEDEEDEDEGGDDDLAPPFLPPQ